MIESVVVTCVDRLLLPDFVVGELVVGEGEVNSCSLHALEESCVLNRVGFTAAVDQGTKEALVDCCL